MSQLLHQIYNANIDLDAETKPYEQELQTARQELSAYEKEFEELLSEKGKEMDMELEAMRNNVAWRLEMDHYINGFKLGARLMIELLG